MLLPVISYKISAAEFGVYSLLLAWSYVISSLLQGTLPAAFQRFYLLDKPSARVKVFSTAFIPVAVLAALVAVFVSFFAGQIAGVALGSQNFTATVTLQGWLLFADTIVFFLLQKLKTEEQYKPASATTAAGGAVSFILSLLLLHYGGFSVPVNALIVAQLVACALQAAYLTLRSDFSLSALVDLPLLNKLIRFSMPLLAGAFATALMDVADRFILDHYLGKREVGLYSFAYRIAMVMYILIVAFRTAWTPLAIRLYKSGDYAVEYGKVFTRLLFVCCSVFLLVSLFAKDAFSISVFGYRLVNPEYAGAAGIIPLVLTGYAFSGLASFYSVYPYVSGNSGHFMFSDLLGCYFNVMLNILLIPVFGVNGAALATAFGYMASAVWLQQVSLRHIRVSYQAGNITILLLVTALLFTAFSAYNIFWLKVPVTLGALLVLGWRLRIGLNPLRAFYNSGNKA